MTTSLIESIQGISRAAKDALECLRAHDYYKEIQKIKDNHLPLDIFPKTIKDIIISVMQYCTPIQEIDNKIPILLSTSNLQNFITNLNTTKDRQLASRFSFIDAQPIHRVAEEFRELGLLAQSNLLENVYSFIIIIRRTAKAFNTRPANSEFPHIVYSPIINPDEISPQEAEEAARFADFCSVFTKNALTTEQKRNLYTAFKELIADTTAPKAHLVIMTAIILLRTKSYYKKTIPGPLSRCRRTIFLSLQLDPETVHSYNDESLKPGAKRPLVKYKEKAAAILSDALR